jgi:hypothetical protein
LVTAPVVAAGAQGRLHVGIAELGERSLVDLHIAAAGSGQRLQLVAEGFNRVIPEPIDILVGARQHRGIAAAEVQRTGAGNGDLRRKPGVGCEKLVVADVDRTLPLHAAPDQRDGL